MHACTYHYRYDLNPHLNNIIILDCVHEKDVNGQKVVKGIDTQPLEKIKLLIMEHLTEKQAVIAVGCMHAEGGSLGGLKAACGWMQMNIPCLLLDVRPLRSERTTGLDKWRFPTNLDDALKLIKQLKLTATPTHLQEGAVAQKLDDALKLMEQLKLTATPTHLQEGAVAQKMDKDSWIEVCADAIFHLVKNADEKIGNKLMAKGLADLFEISRLAFFHNRLLQTHRQAGDKVQDIKLYERILEEERAKVAASNNSVARFQSTMMNKVTDWCTQAEFKAYWALKSDQEKTEILKKNGVSEKEREEYFRDFYKIDMASARTAVHTALSDKNFFSAHVSKTENLSFIVNHVMMDNDGLPDKNTLEGLLVLRQAWDLADIGRYVLKRYKRLAKACYLIMILLAIAIAIVSIQKDMIDKSSLEDGEPKQMYGRCHPRHGGEYAGLVFV